MRLATNKNKKMEVLLCDFQILCTGYNSLLTLAGWLLIPQVLQTLHRTQWGKKAECESFKKNNSSLKIQHIIFILTTTL